MCIMRPESSELDADVEVADPESSTLSESSELDLDPESFILELSESSELESSLLGDCIGASVGDESDAEIESAGCESSELSESLRLAFDPESFMSLLALSSRDCG